MKNAIVLGIGNRLMGDDAIGNLIVDELKRRNTFPGLRILAGETDTDYCLDALEGADPVILIDASSLGTKPCSVTVFPLGSMITKLPASPFSHHYNLIYAMKQQRYEGEGILIAVEACSVTFRNELSPRMEEEFPRIVDEVSQHIETFLGL